MGIQLLSPKSVRRIERAINEPVEFAYTYGHEAQFVTPDDRHGIYNRRDNTVRWLENPRHYYARCPTKRATLKSQG